MRKQKDKNWGTMIYLEGPHNFDRAHWPDRIYPGVGRNTAIKDFCSETNWTWRNLYFAGWRAKDWYNDEIKN